MEIKDQLSIVWKKLWIVILIPMVAALVVAGLQLRQPTEYRATATVAVPGVVSGADALYGGVTGNKAFVSNFLAMAQSVGIAQQVANDTHVPLSDVEAGLTSIQVGDSGVVQVSFQTQHKGLAGKVSKAAADDSLTAVFKPGVDKAKDAVDSAKKAASDAQGAVDAFVARTGIPDPDRAYQVKAQQIASLEQQAVTNQASGTNDGGLAVINSALDTAKKQLADMTPLVTQYQALTEAKDNATRTLDQAESQLVAASTPDDIVRMQQVVKDAKEAVDAAQAPIDAFVARTGLIDPQRSYQVLQQQVSSLQQQAVTSQAHASTPQAGAIQAAIAQAKTDLVALTPLLAEYKNLTDARDASKTPLDAAEKLLDDSTARFSSNDAGKAVSVSSTEEVSILKAAVLKAGATAVGAMFLVILALFALQSGRTRPGGTASEPRTTMAVALGQ